MVGLGNPGEKYLMSRHNVGFMIIDILKMVLNATSFRTQRKCLVSKAQFLEKPLLLVKPKFYMNASGEALFPLVQFYKISLQNSLIIHDDMDQDFRSFRYQKNRGHGGHNGVKDIFEKFKTKDFCRLKVGIGRPLEVLSPSSHVLEGFSSEQEKILPSLFLRICESLKCFVEKGLMAAATKFNTKDFLLDEGQES